MGGFKQRRTEDTTQNDLINISQQMDQLNSPWGTASSVPGINGKCNVYTFISDYQYSPAIISFSDINSCNNGCSGGNCNCSNPITSQGCVDVDQLFAKQVTRSCVGDSELNIETSQKENEMNKNTLSSSQIKNNQDEDDIDRSQISWFKHYRNRIISYPK